MLRTVIHVYKVRWFHYLHARANTHTHTHTHTIIYIYIWSLVWWLQCSSMVRETGCKSLDKSYQKPLKRYIIALCLTLGILRYGSRICGGTQRKEQPPPQHFGVAANKDWAFRLLSTSVGKLTNQPIGLMLTVYQCLRWSGFNSRSSHTKASKNVIQFHLPQCWIDSIQICFRD